MGYRIDYMIEHRIDPILWKDNMPQRLSIILWFRYRPIV